MPVDYIINIVTLLVIIVLGRIVKKHPDISNKIIPIQNIAIAVIVTIVEWVITKDFNTALLASGALAGGTYDVFHSLIQIFKGE